MQAGSLPDRDPFTYSPYGARLIHPEWLGDVGMFALYSVGGEKALQAVATILGALGLALSLALARRWGANAWTAMCWLVAMLPVALPRFTARNDIHALWLAPLVLLLLDLAPSSRIANACRWTAIFLTGTFWANVHTSFVLCPLLVLASGLPMSAVGLPVARTRWAIGAIFALLPMLGPSGTAVYEQLIEHALGAAVYRALLSEWQSPISSGGVLALAPFYLLVGIGSFSLISLAIRERRFHPLRLTTFVLGCFLALMSRRFVPLGAILAIPAATSSFPLAVRDWSESRRYWTRLAAWTVCLAYFCLVVPSLNRRKTRSVFDSDLPVARAAAFVASKAPDGSRLFNAFNDGPWLLWITAPSTKHYWDPRNHAGSKLLSHVTERILPNIKEFDREAKRLAISLVMVRLSDPQQRKLAEYLSVNTLWKLVYWNESHLIYAHDSKINRRLIEEFAYKVLRPHVDLDDLGSSPLNHRFIAEDIARLRNQNPELGTVLESLWRTRDLAEDK